MEFTLAKERLLTPLALVAGAVDKKQVMPILSHILLELDSHELRLTATDLEIEITAKIPCSSNSSGKITVAKKFIDIIRLLEDNGPLRIKIKDGHVQIESGRSRFKIATLPADNYPNNTNAVPTIESKLPRTALIKLLQATYFATSGQDVRIFLNSLLLELDKDSITAVATDGHRMAICKVSEVITNGSDKWLLPKKGIVELLKVLHSISDETITIKAGAGHFQVLSNHYLFSSKLIESRFPPYNKVIPKNQDKFIVIEKELLKRALLRMTILANEKSKAIWLDSKDNTLTLIANNQEQEEATEQLEAQIEGQAIKIALNAGYLLDVLNYFNEGLVRISLISPDHSVLVESLADNQYQYIIMPMKI